MFVSVDMNDEEDQMGCQSSSRRRFTLGLRRSLDISG